MHECFSGTHFESHEHEEVVHDLNDKYSIKEAEYIPDIDCEIFLMWMMKKWKGIMVMKESRPMQISHLFTMDVANTVEQVLFVSKSLILMHAIVRTNV